jgi:CDP-paratose 2-epimerase
MSCIYGDRQFGVEDQGWVAWFTIAALTNKILTVYGDGKQVRDILFVSDLISVFDKFIKSNKKHIVLNIGGGPKNTISLLELLDMLKQKTGKQPKLRFSDWRLADQKVYISNIEEAKKTLGWQPKITPSKGLDILISWLSNYFNK